MNPIATCAATFMEGHPHPALRLSELLPPVADRVDRSLTVERLRESLAEHPESFRLLDPWKGPWRSSTPARSEVTTVRETRATRSQRGGGEEDRRGDVWVVLLIDPHGAAAPCSGSPLTLRESVRWLARCIDARSPLSVSRWYAIALAERESRRALTRRSA
ncbi:MAG: hypothetical protein WD995_11775 [Gemmatimonadota bacterium]